MQLQHVLSRKQRQAAKKLIHETAMTCHRYSAHHAQRTSRLGGGGNAIREYVYLSMWMGWGDLVAVEYDLSELYWTLQQHMQKDTTWGLAGLASQTWVRFRKRATSAQTLEAPRRAGSAPVVGSHVMLARNWASGINFLAKLWLDMRLCNYYRDQTGHNFTPHQINFVVLKVNICNLIVPTLPKDCDIRASHHNHTQSKCLPPSWLRRTRRLFSPTMALRSL